MKKNPFILCALVVFMSCAEMQQIANELPQNFPTNENEIGQGLREALQNGVEKQVSKLTQKDGFYKNELVKIMLPEELKTVDSRLRSLGMSKIADEGIQLINRAAEDAVKEATPIFVNAIKNMSFTDAKNILLSNSDIAATDYLKNATQKELYAKFKPIIDSNYDKVGAGKIWNTMITKYNAIPLVTTVNPDLTDYTAQKAMEGVFTMIATEEKNIRNSNDARTSTLLKKVFAMQD